MTSSRRPRRLVAFLFVAALTIYIVRRPILRAAGEWLLDVDALSSADIAVAMPETGESGLIELADLSASGAVPRVAIMLPEPGPAGRELSRRGVTLDPPERLLLRLGVDPARIAMLDAGEGGTTEGADALAQWATQLGVRRVIVVTGADHSHRLRRALTRALAGRGPQILLRVPTTDPFRPTDWWHQRRTLRSGLVELQKLLIDVLAHPLS